MRQRRQLPAAAVRVSPGRQRRPRSGGGYEAPVAEHRSSSPTAVHVVVSAPVLPGPSGDIASAQGLMPKLQAMVDNRPEGGDRTISELGEDNKSWCGFHSNPSHFAFLAATITSALAYTIESKMSLDCLVFNLDMPCWSYNNF